MKIAIHNRPGSFSDRWVAYCRNNNIPFKLVNCYESDIINQLSDCDALMYHHHHSNFKDFLFAKQLLHSLQQAGKKVFPDFNTSWHFDDKVGQKYLLESIGAPLVPSYVFYSKKEAIDWVKQTTFPKVFKLRGGASSANVKFVKSPQDAKRLIRKAFGRGFSQFNRIGYLKERVGRFRSGKDNIFGVAKGFGRLFFTTEFDKMRAPEKGYVYFQEFLPHNSFDLRIIVIGDKAFGIKRSVRKNDFKASGSGAISHRKEEIDIRCIKTSFATSQRLKAQCLAYDFVFDKANEPRIIEISFGFSPSGYFDCPGFWDSDLIWHEGTFNPYGWMVENIISELSFKQNEIDT